MTDHTDLIGFRYSGADCTIEVTGPSMNLHYVDVLVTDHDSGKTFESCRPANLVRARKRAAACPNCS